MQDSQPLINQLAQELAASSKTLPIEAGQNKTSKVASSAQIDALNEVFALFRINYHNQYYKAYSDTQVLNSIKKLWLDALTEFTPEAILRGAKKVIAESEFLPTLHRMIRACQPSPEEIGLPDAHTAYVEACRAPNPKAAYNWSHPAVYHAGVACDWYFLQSSSEKIAFPIYEKHYLKLCERVMRGETLNAPNAPVLTQTIETPLSTEENIKRMEELRKKLEI
jgi:Replication protein P